MSIVQNIVQDAAMGVEICTTPNELSAIHQPGCAAALWNRQPLQGFQSWLNGLAPEQLPKARVILRPDAVREAVSEVCETRCTPRGVEHDRLVDDIAALSDIFASLMNAKWLRLRMDVVTTNACRRFHIDAVTARLVCTYRGTGTQYGISAAGADPSRFFTTPTGAPILLRGTLRPAEPDPGLVHRSPPIEGTGETRLVLVLDPILDPDTTFDPILEH